MAISLRRRSSDAVSVGRESVVAIAAGKLLGAAEVAKGCRLCAAVADEGRCEATEALCDDCFPGGSTAEGDSRGRAAARKVGDELAMAIGTAVEMVIESATEEVDSPDAEW